jgi:hypothetical protein
MIELAIILMYKKDSFLFFLKSLFKALKALMKNFFEAYDQTYQIKYKIPLGGELKSQYFIDKNKLYIY